MLASIEKIFGTWECSYVLLRLGRRVLAKAAAQVRITAIAYKLKRTVSILAAAARIPERYTERQQMKCQRMAVRQMRLMSHAAVQRNSHPSLITTHRLSRHFKTEIIVDLCNRRNGINEGARNRA
jgi:hypothetical protein